MKILGYDYTISTDKTIEQMEGNAGYCNFDLKTIEIASELDAQMKSSVLLHEIIEAVNFHLEIGLSEAQIKQLESGLHSIVFTEESLVR